MKNENLYDWEQALIDDNWGKICKFCLDNSNETLNVGPLVKREGATRNVITMKGQTTTLILSIDNLTDNLGFIKKCEIITLKYNDFKKSPGENEKLTEELLGLMRFNPVPAPKKRGRPKKVVEENTQEVQLVELLQKEVESNEDSDSTAEHSET